MSDVVLGVRPLGFVWDTLDPFLFCVHHDDAYPAGDGLGRPAASLAGRQLGMDFEGRDGWRMYHGRQVPGFPAHPHRGFETVTLVRRGLIDHADSLGAAARFGGGDCQWMTAGAGVVHSEMFPLVHTDRGNPLELFQIWLNLPPEDKMAAPHFTMLWADRIPKIEVAPGVVVTAVCGAPADVASPPPPPASWASRPDAHVAIWVITLATGASWTMPATPEGVGRMLYAFTGAPVTVGGRPVRPKSGASLRPGAEVPIRAGDGPSELVLLQGRPIGAPVAQHGPFVMNSDGELRQAFADYQRTRFGGWPWPGEAPVHREADGRFARHVDGRLERPA